MFYNIGERAWNNEVCVCSFVEKAELKKHDCPIHQTNILSSNLCHATAAGATGGNDRRAGLLLILRHKNRSRFRRPRDRNGRFRTDVFERYSRGEKALPAN